MRLLTRPVAAVLLESILFIVSGLACATQGSEEKIGVDVVGHGASMGAQGDLAALQPLVQPYPAGRWRLARAEDLSRVVLWVSHILIRHEAVQPGVVSFDLGDWTPAAAAPARNRVEAFQLAEGIARQLRARPDEFATFARSFSEDIATSAQGGSLGGICASELYRRHPEILDVLATLQPGELSRVVETNFGFHILQRRAPPPEGTVSGSRVIISYDEAPWLRNFLARHPDLPARRRTEALALADLVYARARDGEDFDALVASYSEHQDAVRNGDFGEWPTRQCTPFPREVELLQSLDVGEVAAPIDTPFGVQILKRTPNRPRQLYAMTIVQEPFDPSRAEDHPSSRGAVLDRMNRWTRELQADPLGFEALQQKYCCVPTEQWRSGRGSAVAERALDSLLDGQLSASPIDLGGAYAIVKRVPPEPEVEQPFELQLPAPDKPDIYDLALNGEVNYQLAKVAKRYRERLGLEGKLAEEFGALHDEVSKTEAEFAEDRLARFKAVLGKVEAMLGAERYQEYLKFLEQYFEERLLTPRVGRRVR